jgi:hypothetical protein
MIINIGKYNMKFDRKSSVVICISLLPLPIIISPSIANVEPQVIFGLSNLFWSGFITGSAIGGMIISIWAGAKTQFDSQASL